LVGESLAFACTVDLQPIAMHANVITMAIEAGASAISK
jgi:hypothetical protein